MTFAIVDALEEALTKYTGQTKSWQSIVLLGSYPNKSQNVIHALNTY